MKRDEMLEHLTSPASLRAKYDALLFAEIVQRTGGHDTFWTQSVRDAMKQDAGPLRDQHHAEMIRRTRARERLIVEILKRYAIARQGALPTAEARLGRRENRELAGSYKKYALESFVVWATKNRRTIEDHNVTNQQRYRKHEEDGLRQYVRLPAPSRSRSHRDFKLIALTNSRACAIRRHTPRIKLHDKTSKIRHYERTP